MRARICLPCVAGSSPKIRSSPVGHRRHAADHPHRRRLAGTVRAEEAERLAALHLDVDAVDGGEVAEALDQRCERRSMDRTCGARPYRSARDRIGAVSEQTLLRVRRVTRADCGGGRTCHRTCVEHPRRTRRCHRCRRVRRGFGSSRSIMGDRAAHSRRAAILVLCGPGLYVNRAIGGRARAADHTGDDRAGRRSERGGGCSTDDRGVGRQPPGHAGSVGRLRIRACARRRHRRHGPRDGWGRTWTRRWHRGRGGGTARCALARRVDGDVGARLGA